MFVLASQEPSGGFLAVLEFLEESAAFVETASLVLVLVLSVAAGRVF